DEIADASADLDPVLAAKALPIALRVLEQAAHPLAIVRMDRLEKGVERTGSRLRLLSEDARELLRPEHGGALPVPTPASNLRELLRGEQADLALTQLALDAPAHGELL